MSLVGVVIHVDSNGVEVVEERQLCDKINADILPRSCRDFLRLENSFEVLYRLIVLTPLTAQNILIHE
jgi:hypothetical protein